MEEKCIKRILTKLNQQGIAYTFTLCYIPANLCSQIRCLLCLPFLEANFKVFSYTHCTFMMDVKKACSKATTERSFSFSSALFCIRDSYCDFGKIITLFFCPGGWSFLWGLKVFLLLSGQKAKWNALMLVISVRLCELNRCGDMQVCYLQYITSVKCIQEISCLAGQQTAVIGTSSSGDLKSAWVLLLCTLLAEHTFEISFDHLIVGSKMSNCTAY